MLAYTAWTWMGLEKVSHCNNPSVVEKRKISYRRCITLRKTDSTLTGRPFHHWRLTSPTLQTVKKNKTEENEISPYGAGNTSKKTQNVFLQKTHYIVSGTVSVIGHWTVEQNSRHVCSVITVTFNYSENDLINHPIRPLILRLQMTWHDVFK